MSKETNIEWCDSTVNFWSGCTKVSPGCAHCYAETRDKRHMIEAVDHWGKGAPRLIHVGAVKQALALNRKPWICDGCGKHWSSRQWVSKPDSAPAENVCCGKPYHRRRIFSLSLGDWLDEEVPIGWLAEMLDTIHRCDQVTWILCTKRPKMFWGQEQPEYKLGRLEAVQSYALGKQMNKLHEWLCLWGNGRPPKNIILLASVENQAMADLRIPQLLAIPAAARGLSLEPLLGPVNLNLVSDALDRAAAQQHRPTLDWLILGGESGAGARVCEVNWIRSLAQQGHEAGVAVFVKQLGARPVFGEIDAALGFQTLRDKKGGDLKEWPADLRVQQWPVLRQD